MKSKIKFSLIICGYNEEENLNLCIKSCLNLNYDKKSYEIIYVDNNSKDNSIKTAKKYPIKVFLEKKQGASEARNKGIKESKGEILVFLDADIKLTKDYLTNMEAEFNDPSVGAAGGKVLPLKKSWISNYLGVSLLEKYPRFKKNRYVRNMPSCNLAVRKKVLDKGGNFKEKFDVGEISIPRSEDKELCERIRKKSYKILYNSKAIIFHKNRSNFKDLFRVWIKGARSRLFVIKNTNKDFFSQVFRYNLPILLTIFALVLLVIKWELFLGLILLILIISFSLSIKSFLETGLFFQSFFIKPWMDILSLLIINLSVLYYRLK